MFIKVLYMFCFGYLTITVQGFFIERFLNLCKNHKIFIKDLQLEEGNTYLKAKILKTDFKEVSKLAKISKCKIKIHKKIGIPFILKKYRKRNIFLYSSIIILIFIFVITNFVWNIEIIGNEKISNDEIIKILNEKGIKPGKLKYGINTENIVNQIRIERDDLSWIGININGTNVIVTVEESIPKPEIIDQNEVCDIIASKDCIISKIIVQNGTAKVKPGDEVKKGDLLVSRIVESQYFENREVHAEADVYGKFYLEKSKKGYFLENEKIETGKEENKTEICINNFKINFNKGVSNFENYDKIVTNQKVKFFSNFYLPIEIKNIKYIEIQNELKKYSRDELQSKIENDIEIELEKDFKLSEYENKTRDVIVNEEDDGLTVKVIYEIQENIGIKKNY